MPFSLPLLVLPFIAAVIGYFTNWVAIKMLFRPREEVRILGLRVPFTPGVIPRKRDQIAASIGDAVADNLLTSEAVAERLGSEEVRAKVDVAIYNWIEDIFQREWGSVEDIVPDELTDQWHRAVDYIESSISDLIVNFLSRPETREMVNDFLDDFIEDLSEQRLDEFFDEEVRDSLVDLVETVMVNLTEEDDFERQVEDFWESRLEDMFEQEGSLNDYVAPETKEFIYEKLEDLLPLALVRLADFLDDPGIRKKIKMYLFDLVDELLDREFKEDSVWDQLKRGMLETLVISTEKMKLRIDQAVDEGIPKLTGLLQNEDVRLQIQQSISEYLDDLMEKDLSEIDVSGERKERISESLSRATVAIARNDKIRQFILRFLRTSLERMSERSLEDLLPPEDREGIDQLQDKIVDHLLQSLGSEEGKRRIRGLISDISSNLRNRPIGSMEDLVRREWISPVQNYATEAVLGLLERETPKILQTLNVSKLVKKEVGRFSLPDVEQLILDVTGDQLRAITWFGALIGFVIGLVQIFILSVIV